MLYLLCYFNKLYGNAYQTHQAWEHVYSHQDNCRPYGELISTLDTDDFERELCLCHIGSRIKQGDQTSDELLTYVLGVFDANLANILPEKQNLINDFRNYIREERVERHAPIAAANAHHGTIVFINADRVNERER